MRCKPLAVTFLAVLTVALGAGPAIAAEKGDRHSSETIQAERAKLSPDKSKGENRTVTRPDKTPSMVAKPKRSRPGS